MEIYSHSEGSRSNTRTLDRERKVLWLLSQGATVSRIAGELHVARRTVDTSVATVRRELGAVTRFQIGAFAVRANVLSACDICTSARRSRATSQWVDPSERQSVLLAHVAQGMTVVEVADEVGIGHRTVERDLSRLGVMNGVTGMVGLGALAETLGFI